MSRGLEREKEREREKKEAREDERFLATRARKRKTGLEQPCRPPPRASAAKEPPPPSCPPHSTAAAGKRGERQRLQTTKKTERERERKKKGRGEKESPAPPFFHCVLIIVAALCALSRGPLPVGARSPQEKKGGKGAEKKLARRSRSRSRSPSFLPSFLPSCASTPFGLVCIPLILRFRKEEKAGRRRRPKEKKTHCGAHRTTHMFAVVFSPLLSFSLVRERARPLSLPVALRTWEHIGGCWRESRKRERQAREKEAGEARPKWKPPSGVVQGTNYGREDEKWHNH